MQKDILDFLSEFAVFLQDHKFAVSESALAHLLRSVESAGVDITEEDEMLAALSVCLAKTGEQVAKLKALFREFLSKKTIPQREEQKEKEKQEKRKELDLFVSDAQKQLENLKKQKESQYYRLKTTFGIHPHTTHHQKDRSFHQYPGYFIGNNGPPAQPAGDCLGFEKTLKTDSKEYNSKGA